MHEIYDPIHFTGVSDTKELPPYISIKEEGIYYHTSKTSHTFKFLCGLLHVLAPTHNKKGDAGIAIAFPIEQKINYKIIYRKSLAAPRLLKPIEDLLNQGFFLYKPDVLEQRRMLVDYLDNTEFLYSSTSLDENFIKADGAETQSCIPSYGEGNRPYRSIYYRKR